MKSGHRYIIHILIILIFVFGLGLLLWRNEVFNILHDNSGVYDPSLLINSPLPTAKDALDTAIFDNAKFIVLKNNVYKFDFDTICRDVSAQKQSGTTNDQLTAQEYAASVVCLLGNSAPFAASAVDKAPITASSTDKTPVKD